LANNSVRKNVQRQSSHVHTRISQVDVGVGLKVLKDLVQILSVVCGVNVKFVIGDLGSHSNSACNVRE
jgi:hypothetical protein